MEEIKFKYGVFKGDNFQNLQKYLFEEFDGLIYKKRDFLHVENPRRSNDHLIHLFTEDLKESKLFRYLFSPARKIFPKKVQSKNLEDYSLMQFIFETEFEGRFYLEDSIWKKLKVSGWKDISFNNGKSLK